LDSYAGKDLRLMIVPKFWAEGRIRERVEGRQVTVRRFGWSDASQADAQAMADTRTREALARIVAGQELVRRELKRAYNGSEGVPIREEIVAQFGEVIITRNGYGALCLNTPNVLFADIDFQQSVGPLLALLFIWPLLAGAVALGWFVHWGLGCMAAVLAVGLGYLLAAAWRQLTIRLAGGDEQLARQRLERFLTAHPHWYLRLYRTPAGLRVLALHQMFDPGEPAVTECFRALGTDPIYAQMCLRQRCFRARVSPKPWRVGINRHVRPCGVWPIDESRLPERQAWVSAYEQAAHGYASCQFLAALGSGAVHPTAAEVQRLHDDLCQANRALPLA
jgi:hypothetical protein